MSFTLYPAHSTVGNLELRNCVPININIIILPYFIIIIVNRVSKMTSHIHSTTVEIIIIFLLQKLKNVTLVAIFYIRALQYYYTKCKYILKRNFQIQSAPPASEGSFFSQFFKVRLHLRKRMHMFHLLTF